MFLVLCWFYFLLARLMRRLPCGKGWSWGGKSPARSASCGISSAVMVMRYGSVMFSRFSGVTVYSNMFTVSKNCSSNSSVM